MSQRQSVNPFCFRPMKLIQSYSLPFSMGNNPFYDLYDMLNHKPAR